MEVITLLKSERKNSLIIKENIVYLLQKLTLIKNFQTCPFEAPEINYSDHQVLFFKLLYERWAGISVGIDLGQDVIIDAVSKGFDGREVSKSICTHERYFIPWYDLRKINIGNFKKCQTFQIDNEEYQKTRNERIEFLKSVGLNPEIFSSYIPEKYQAIPDLIWLSVIKNLLKQLEKNEDILMSYGFTNSAISGHTEGKQFSPWQMFDKSRYTLAKGRTK